MDEPDISEDFSPLNPKIVLGIAAHPDDLDYAAAGTMAKFAGTGAEIHYLIITDGSKGSDDLHISEADLIKMREDEQRAAVQILGGKGVTFLGYPDGELEVTMKLKKDIVRVIRTIKPDVVITLDPTLVYSVERGFINHPDHRAAGQAALDAIFPLARDHLTFPDLYAEGFEPHKTAIVLLSNFGAGNYFVDITDTFETKMAALKAHESQIPDVDGTRVWMETVARKNGELCDYELAESFMRINVRG
ncbi:MAG: family deacetylase [Candidatus Saccharibacteria bacterium]|nr:family deacetylase [Candidatus Saccharibacteria bacterium]